MWECKLINRSLIIYSYFLVMSATQKLCSMAFPSIIFMSAHEYSILNYEMKIRALKIYKCLSPSSSHKSLFCSIWIWVLPHDLTWTGLSVDIGSHRQFLIDQILVITIVLDLRLEVATAHLLNVVVYELGRRLFPMFGRTLHWGRLECHWCNFNASLFLWE